jgi:hypothetical protein
MQLSTQATHKATHSGQLIIGDIRIPCFVIDNGARTVTTAGAVRALGMRPGGIAGQLGVFLSGNAISPFVSKELLSRGRSPIVATIPTGAVAHLYDAMVIPEACKAVLAMRRAGVILPKQRHIAEQCELVLSALATVGIVALVDEATGYQSTRPGDALAKILEQFIHPELRPWAKTFPDEYYKQLFRLRGWSAKSIKSRPGVVAKWTIDMVYDRLPPGVLEELRRVTPRDDSGHLKHRLHQRLTPQVGHPRLREHLHTVIALMRASSHWKGFKEVLNRALPKARIAETDQRLLPYGE